MKNVIALVTILLLCSMVHDNLSERIVREIYAVDAGKYLTATDEGVEGTNFSPSEQRRFFRSISGRVYVRANQWRGFNAAYGAHHHQFSQTYTTGAEPTPSRIMTGINLWNELKGERGRLVKISGWYRGNNNDIGEVRCRIIAQTKKDGTTAHENRYLEPEFSFKGDTNNRWLEYDLTEGKFTANEVIGLVFTGATSATRYLYFSELNFEFER